MVRLVLALFLGASVLALVAFGVLHFERTTVESAASTNARLGCCAGPDHPRSPQRQDEAAEQCPEALRSLGWVSSGVGEPAAQARYVLTDCPGAAIPAPWPRSKPPPDPPRVAAPPAASAPDAGVGAGAALADREAAEAARLSRGGRVAGWEDVAPVALGCEEFPPECGDGGPCPAFSREALLAAAALEPEARAARLRAWLCDRSDAGTALQAEAALREAGALLRSALPPYRAEANPQEEAQAADAGPQIAQAQRLLCALPWSTLLGGARLLGAMLGCPACGRASDYGDGEGSPECLPGVEQGDVAPRVCVLGYAQALEPLSGVQPAGIEACKESAEEANQAAQEAEEARAREHARRIVQRLRAARPLGAVQWAELAEQVAILDYRGDEAPIRGSFSVVGREAPDAAALRKRIAPLLEHATAPDELKGKLPPLPQAPLSILAFPGGVVVKVCDDTPIDSLKAGELPIGRRALFWLTAERVVALEPPRIDVGSNDPEQGPPGIAPCAPPIDVADLDGDGTPELVLRANGGRAVRAITLTDPPADRSVAGTLAVSVKPLSAAVLVQLKVDGTPVETGRQLLAFFGPHLVRAEAPGFKPAEATATVVSGQTASVTLALELEPSRVGETWQEPKSGLEFVQLPAGELRYGCEPRDTACDEDEKPAKEGVKVPAFSLGKTDVTLAAYRRCVDAGTCNPAATGPRCNWGTDRQSHPINCVDFQQGLKFCGWIGGRLPTAVEWEYAAKGGEGRIYPWGDQPVTGKRANHCDKNCAAEWRSQEDDLHAATSPVGSYPEGAARWGFFDLSGNVAQWVSSYVGQLAMHKGGSWNDKATDLRASHRGALERNSRLEWLGFRCAF